jgi:hypothetical protein
MGVSIVEAPCHVPRSVGESGVPRGEAALPVWGQHMKTLIATEDEERRLLLQALARLLAALMG